ncbi:MAG TPA: hypothetical protein VK698_39605 [Kofleriaceae bacterium]|nr:hypothetical protein [Kofleriaceae bacterium]
MTILRPETTILAAALCDLPDADPAVQQRLGAGLVRALHVTNRDPDFEDSYNSGHVETDLDAWAARVDTKNHRHKPPAPTLRRTGGTA